MIYQSLFSPIEVELLSYPILTNRKELEKGGATLRRPIVACHTAGWAILDVSDSISVSEEFWNKSFRGTAKGQESEIIRIASWLEKSEKEEDNIQSFILSWIGFNGLYSLFASLNKPNLRNDADKFEFIIKELINNNHALDIIKNHKELIYAFTNYNIKSDNG